MFLTDNYSHPVPNVNYIKESILGPGGDRDLYHSWLEINCPCFLESDCMSRCACIKKFGQNYRNGLLLQERLNNERSIYECGEYCSCDALCNNRVVQRGPNNSLKIQEAGEKGLGVFANKSFLPGTFIAEYAGEIISKEVTEERYQLGKDKYILALKEHYAENIVETYFDAYSNGNISRYINHSCSPNCVVVPTRIGCVIPKAAIFSKQIIERCEEITYAYQDTPIMSASKCFCKSPNCKGFLPTTNV